MHKFSQQTLHSPATARSPIRALLEIHYLKPAWLKFCNAKDTTNQYKPQPMAMLGQQSASQIAPHVLTQSSCCRPSQKSLSDPRLRTVTVECRESTVSIQHLSVNTVGHYAGMHSGWVHLQTTSHYTSQLRLSGQVTLRLFLQ